MYLPQNITCNEFYTNPLLNLTGFVLAWSISKCLDEQEGDSLGGNTIGFSRGIDEFVTKIANDYFVETKQVILLYDESWEINSVIQKLETTTKKSFVLYYLPQQKALADLIKSKPPDHLSHRLLPKGSAFVVFVKDEDGFQNILELTSMYPWWTITARVLVLVKERSLEPTKGILTIMDKERIFNGAVATEISGQGNSSSSSSSQGSGSQDQPLMSEQIEGAQAQDGENLEATTAASLFELNVEDNKAFLQVAVVDPYPAEGQSKHSFIGRWGNGKLDTKRPIFLEKIDNLRGFTLKVCTFEFPPLVIKVETETPGVYDYTGLEVKILSELAKTINFTYEIYEPPVGEKWGIDTGNGSWNGLIGEVAENRAQIGFASVFLLDQRESVVDVSDAYDQDAGCFAVPRPEALQHWLGLVLPFSWQVWACFISMALVSGPLISLITRPLKMDASISIGRGIMYALGSMVSVQQPPKARSSSLRAFIIAWLVFCWMSCIIYRVSLIVSLTVGPTDYKIDTISQLVRSGLEWGGFEEVLKTFSNSSDRNDEKLFERFVPLTNIRDALDRVAKDGDFAVLDSGKFLRYAANGIYFDGISSSIHVAKECPTTYNVGFVTPIGSPYMDKINTLIRRFQNAGLIEKWLADIVFEAAIKNPNRKSADARTYGLSLNHLKLCFVLVLFGHFFGFISFCVEHCVSSHYKKKAKRSRKTSKISEFSIKSIASSSPSIVVTDTHED